MLVSSFRSLTDLLIPCLYLAPDNGGGDGGGDNAGDNAGGSDGGDTPKYTDAELQERIKSAQIRYRKGLQKDLETQKQANAELTKKLSDLQAQLEEVSTSKGDDKTLDGKIELLNKRWEKQVLELQDKVRQANEKQAQAELRAHETRRDTLINEALVAAECRDLRIGYRTILPDVVYDEVDEQWMLKTPSGALVEIKEGVKELLPDYLKASSAQGGGSGSRGGSPRREQRLTELEREKKKLEELKTAGGNSAANSAAVDAYLLQKRKVAKLEQELLTIK
jgi:hypothetical protein